MNYNNSVAELKASFTFQSFAVAKQYLHFVIIAIRACTELDVLWSLGRESWELGNHESYYDRREGSGEGDH